jgi:hypothetical protein
MLSIPEKIKVMLTLSPRCESIEGSRDTGPPIKLGTKLEFSGQLSAPFALSLQK